MKKLTIIYWSIRLKINTIMIILLIKLGLYLRKYGFHKEKQWTDMCDKQDKQAWGFKDHTGLFDKKI